MGFNYWHNMLLVRLPHGRLSLARWMGHPSRPVPPSPAWVLQDYGISRVTAAIRAWPAAAVQAPCAVNQSNAAAMDTHRIAAYAPFTAADAASFARARSGALCIKSLELDAEISHHSQMNWAAL